MYSYTYAHILSVSALKEQGTSENFETSDSPEQPAVSIGAVDGLHTFSIGQGVCTGEILDLKYATVAWKA